MLSKSIGNPIESRFYIHGFRADSGNPKNDHLMMVPSIHLGNGHVELVLQPVDDALYYLSFVLQAARFADAQADF